MVTQRLKGLWIPAEILLRDSQKCLEGIDTNNYSASQKQLYPISNNDKDV